MKSVGTLYREKLARDDVTQYYSLWFLPTTQREPAMALYALWLELREINDECTDPQIARIKLAWWHEELQRLHAGARHPLTRALAPAAARHALPTDAFDGLLAALGAHVDAVYPTYQTLREYGQRTRGCIESLAARIAGHTDATTLTLAAEVGATLEFAALIHSIGADARRRRVYLPHDDMARYGVTVEDLYAARPGDTVNVLLTHLLARLHEELARHASALDAGASAWLSSSRVAVTATQALIAKMCANPAALWHAPPALTPWRLLWTAWRAAQRERRHRLQ